MYKNQQKWVALFVAVTFIWLLQISVMPVSAAGTAEQASIANTEQGPDYFEAVGHKSAPAKKKSILPWILIGVGVLTITAVVLFLFVLNGYDITGQWSMTYTWSGGWSPGTVTLTFTGKKKSGSMVSSSGATANYTVDGKTVTWTYPSTGTVYTGTFSSKDSMSGTMVDGDGDGDGTWTATRVAAASASSSPAKTTNQVKETGTQR